MQCFHGLTAPLRVGGDGTQPFPPILIIKGYIYIFSILYSLTREAGVLGYTTVTCSGPRLTMPPPKSKKLLCLVKVTRE
jgi:hypothetical protein